MIFITVPDPVTFRETNDWGYPDPDNYEHYRIYGRDFIYKLDKIIGSAGQVKAYKVIDDVTGVKDIVDRILKM